MVGNQSSWGKAVTETITIKCEWDIDELRSTEVFLNDKAIRWNQLRGTIVNKNADILAKSAGRWKIEQDKRSVSP